MTFKAGEIVEARSAIGRYPGWIEVEIVDVLPYGEVSQQRLRIDYGVIETGLRGDYKGYAEDHLRKKRPPQQDNQACGEDFKTLINNLNTKIAEPA